MVKREIGGEIKVRFAEVTLFYSYCTRGNFGIRVKVVTLLHRCMSPSCIILFSCLDGSWWKMCSPMLTCVRVFLQPHIASRRRVRASLCSLRCSFIIV